MQNTDKPTDANQSQVTWLGIALSSIIILSPFLPWVTSPIGSMSAMDSGGLDGWLIFMLGVGCLGVFLYGKSQNSMGLTSGVFTGLAGLSLSGIFLANLIGVNRKVESIDLLNVGYGLHIGFTVSIMMMGLGVWVCAKHKSLVSQAEQE